MSKAEEKSFSFSEMLDQVPMDGEVTTRKILLKILNRYIGFRDWDSNQIVHLLNYGTEHKSSFQETFINVDEEKISINLQKSSSKTAS